MRKLRKFTIEVDDRDNKGTVDDRRVWFRMETHDAEKPWQDRPAGIHHVSFLFIGDEWRGMFEKFSYCAADIAHRVDTFGELWTFYDLNVPQNDLGKMVIPYLRITVPLPVRDMIKERIENAIAEWELPHAGVKDRTPIQIDLSPELAGWAESYGRGSGVVELADTTDTATRDALGSFAGSESFDRCWEVITNMARNTTHAKTDVAIVKVWLESGGRSFGWVAGGMHGGLINHGSDDAPEWSVHT